MNLENLVSLFLNVSDKMIKRFPLGKNQINSLTVNLSELASSLLYDKNTDKNYKYPGTSVKSIEVNSILNIFRKIDKTLNQRNVDKEELLQLMSDLNVQLKWFQWYMSSARRSIKSIVNEVDKSD